ncbi:hypothetical protein GJ496_009869 [Pomphorhynchus laevis]|nr:hypothetical protein GJ496_009869 [Pomphorhynchus laevis]
MRRLKVIIPKCQFSQSVPIILLCTDCDKKNLENATAIDLIYENEKIATLLDPEFYSFRKDEHCARLFGTTDFNHPTIQNIAKDGSWLIGGNLEDYKRPLWNDGLDHYRLNVKELRQQIELANNNVDSVVAFQVRNPLHNGHILLINEALNKLSEKGYINTIVLLHPLGGWTKDDDVPLDVRVKQHEVYLKELNWANKTWHAKARAQVGVTHYIVGRDPAGIPHSNGSDMYDPTHGGKVLSLVNHLLPLEFLSFPVAALCKSTRKMTFYDPKRKEDFEFISGTLMRSYARQKLNPPSGFMNNKAWNIIAEYYNSKL